MTATTAKSRTQLHTPSYDWGLLSVVIVLLALGLVMVFSASFASAMDGYNDAFYFVERQVIWTAVGLVLLIFTARIPYTFWQRWSIFLMGIALLALMAVIVFGTEKLGPRARSLAAAYNLRNRPA